MSDKDILLEFGLQEILAYIVEDTGVSIKDAIKNFYSSKIFEKLESMDNGLYKESPAYIYELYKDEQKFGKIVQLEI